MEKFLKSAWAWVSLAAWVAGYIGLVWWLVGGHYDRLLLDDLPLDWAMPLLVGGLLMLVAWSALPKWRCLESPERVLWGANLPSRIGSVAQAIVTPLFPMPSPTLVPEWLADHDYLRVAGMAVLTALALWILWKGLHEATAEKVSVKVSAAGIQVLGEVFPWSDIEAIESGHLKFEGGAAIVLAGRTVKLSPEKHGPTGRALISAVQRFSPGTVIREPRFQAAFGAA